MDQKNVMCTVQVICSSVNPAAAQWIYNWDNGPKFAQLESADQLGDGVVACCWGCKNAITQQWNHRRAWRALERLAWDFGDLTQPRWVALDYAAHSNLDALRSDVHQIMAHLISEDLQLTPTGWALYHRILRYHIYGTPPPAIPGFCPDDYDAIVDYRRARKLAAAGTGSWIRSVHLKLMYALALQPELGFKHLGLIYGEDTMMELREHGLAAGEMVLGSGWQLTQAGVELLERLRSGRI